MTMTGYVSAAITNDAEFAADCARRAKALHAKADKETDWVERDRLRRVACALDDDARFWGKPA